MPYHLAAGRAADVVQLAAYAGELLGAHGFGVYLSVEVDLQAGIDRNHLMILRDDKGVIDIVNRKHHNVRVVINKFI